MVGGEPKISAMYVPSTGKKVAQTQLHIIVRVMKNAEIARRSSYKSKILHVGISNNSDDDDHMMMILRP